MAAVEDKEESNAMFTSIKVGLMHTLTQLNKGTRYPEMAIWTGIRS